MKKYSSFLIKILISGILLAVLFYKIPFSEIVAALRSADSILITFGMALLIPILFLSAFETTYLTKVQGMEIKTFEMVKIHLATYFYGLFLPGTLAGGAVKWYKLKQHGTKADAAAVVVMNRFLEILMLVFTALIFVLPLLAAKKLFFLMFLCLIVFLLIAAAYYMLFHAKTLGVIEKIIISFSPGLIKNKVTKFLSSIKKFQNLSRKDHFEILGLMFFYHLLTVVSFYLLAMSLDLDISFFDIGWIRSAVIFLNMLPISFAGLGIREGSLVYCLGFFNISPSLAIAYSFLIFLRTIIFAIAGGVDELFNHFSFNPSRAGAD